MTIELGFLPPEIRTVPPGPEARALSNELARLEAPGINTLYGGQPNILWQQARGCNVVDVDGNRYLDLTSGFGVAAVGHAHPKVLRAVAEQGQRLVHGLGDAAGHEPRIALAQALRALAPMEDAQVYYAVSGADAVEIALKTATLATGRTGVLAFDPSYHGLTLGALAVTTRPSFRQPFASHLHRQVHHLPFACDPARVEELLTQQAEIGCVILEPIVGREGLLVPPPGWLAAIAEICRQHRVLLIADEIFTGFSRTGSLFAVQHEGVVPDLLCCGKALGGGLPIACVLASAQCFKAWDAPGEARHTATFVANPLACAAAFAALEVLHDDGVQEQAARLGEETGARISSWPDRFPQVREVRGRGLLWGVELRSAATASTLTRCARERGVLLLAGGPAGRVAQIVPPLVMPGELLQLSLDILEGVLGDGSCSGPAAQDPG